MQERCEPMTTADAQSSEASPPTPTRPRRIAPVIALVLLSPIIVDVLFGTIRVTTIVGLLPAAGGWGCGALLIRELARRRNLGWPSILLLGLALAVAEECLILQMSLAPLLGIPDPNQVYGRAFGVNWPWFLWALGYESVWAVAIPILIVEWMYPKRRNEPWIGRVGLVVSAVVFAVAGVATWYSWTQVLVPKDFPASVYRVPPSSIVAALAAIVVLVAAALNVRATPRDEPMAAGIAPRPWPVGIAAFATGLAWFVLVFLAYGAAPSLPVAITMAAGVGLAGAAAWFVHRWTSRPDWRDVHTLALVSGALLASMLAGYPLLIVSAAPPIDYAGKLILNAIAVAWLIRLGRRLGRDASWDWAGADGR
jgi:hypothetical protein